MPPSRKPASPTVQVKPKRPPATTPQARENQMVALAVGLAERQILEGTASSQVITHFLKLGTMREQLEKEKLSRENELLKSKAEAIASGARVEEMYKQALNAMREYSGKDQEPDYDE